MLQLIYASNAAFSFSEKDLEELLIQARDFNNSKEITGLLIYHNENFMQVIEGPDHEIEKLYSRIENDSRHHHVTLIYKEPIEKKDFGDWSMGFVDTRTIEQPVEGFVDFNTDMFELINDDTKAKRILRMFHRIVSKD